MGANFLEIPQFPLPFSPRRWRQLNKTPGREGGKASGNLAPSARQRAQRSRGPQFPIPSRLRLLASASVFGEAEASPSSGGDGDPRAVRMRRFVVPGVGRRGVAGRRAAAGILLRRHPGAPHRPPLLRPLPILFQGKASRADSLVFSWYLASSPDGRRCWSLMRLG